MTDMTRSAWLLLAAVVVISSAIAVAAVTDSVPFERLDRFARRQRLRITPGNAAVVMRYLGTTQRWRAVGLAVALCYTVAAGLRHDNLVLSVHSVFIGWFAGAVVAEWRLNAPPRGLRRHARLTRRRRRGYLGAGELALPWLAAALALGAGLAGLARVARDPYAPRALIVAAIALAMLSITAVVVVGRHIVLRPQPAAIDEDVRAADDALRARSLRVLTGSTTALVMMAAATLILAAPDLDRRTALGLAIAAQALGLLAAAYLFSAPGRAAAPSPEPRAAR
jgi:amino acid transporter